MEYLIEDVLVYSSLAMEGKEKLKGLMCFTANVLYCVSRKRGISSQPSLYLKQVTLTLPPLLLQ